jgi:hypothetical protein
MKLLHIEDINNIDGENARMDDLTLSNFIHTQGFLPLLAFSINRRFIVTMLGCQQYILFHPSTMPFTCQLLSCKLVIPQTLAVCCPPIGLIFQRLFSFFHRLYLCIYLKGALLLAVSLFQTDSNSKL